MTQWFNHDRVVVAKCGTPSVPRSSSVVHIVVLALGCSDIIMAGFGFPSPSAQLEHGFVVPYTAAQLQQGREAHMREEAERHELRMHKLFMERQEDSFHLEDTLKW